MKVRYADLVDFKKKKDTRTADEIIADTIEKAGLVVVDNECI